MDIALLLPVATIHEFDEKVKINMELGGDRENDEKPLWPALCNLQWNSSNFVNFKLTYAIEPGLLRSSEKWHNAKKKLFKLILQKKKMKKMKTKIAFTIYVANF